MPALQNQVINGSRKRPIAFDLSWMETGNPKPLVVFAHGFKGFKDWGHFAVLDDAFALGGFVFCKFNFSHNGTTPAHPTTFVDLDGFYNNNVTTELDDLGCLLDHLLGNQSPVPSKELDATRVFLIGHSRGGGTCILKTVEDERITRLVTWAAISDYNLRFPPDVRAEWKRSGELRIENARTNQQMPIGYQAIQDLEDHPYRTDIPSAARRVAVPWLIVHGTHDATVPLYEAENLHRINPKAQFLLITGAGHTFGSRHPRGTDRYPGELRQVLDETLRFLKAD